MDEMQVPVLVGLLVSGDAGALVEADYPGYGRIPTRGRVRRIGYRQVRIVIEPVTFIAGAPVHVVQAQFWLRGEPRPFGAGVHTTLRSKDVLHVDATLDVPGMDTMEKMRAYLQATVPA